MGVWLRDREPHQASLTGERKGLAARSPSRLCPHLLLVSGRASGEGALTVIDGARGCVANSNCMGSVSNCLSQWRVRWCTGLVMPCPKTALIPAFYCVAGSAWARPWGAEGSGAGKQRPRVGFGGRYPQANCRKIAGSVAGWLGGMNAGRPAVEEENSTMGARTCLARWRSPHETGRRLVRLRRRDETTDSPVGQTGESPDCCGWSRASGPQRNGRAYMPVVGLTGSSITEVRSVQTRLRADAGACWRRS